MSIPSDPFIALLSHIAHEMRAPLSAAQGYGRMLSSGRYGALTDGQSRAVEATARCCERLSDLAEQLSLLGKIERGELQPAAGTTALEPLLAAVASAHVPHADHPVQVAHVPSAHTPADTASAGDGSQATVRADAALLRRTVAALLDAVVRSAPDESTVQLVARADSAGARSPGTSPSAGTAARIVAVIAPADRVDALWTIDDAALDPLNDFEPGLGLGLAIARRVVTAAGGRVGAHRQQGALAVRLTLPLVS